MMLCRTVELPENSSSLRKRETRRSRIKPLYYSKDLLLLDTMYGIQVQYCKILHIFTKSQIKKYLVHFNISQQFVQARNHHLTIFLLLVLSFARSSRGPLPCTPCVLQGGWWGNTHGGPRIDCERAREKWEVSYVQLKGDPGIKWGTKKCFLWDLSVKIQHLQNENILKCTTTIFVA